MVNIRIKKMPKNKKNNTRKRKCGGGKRNSSARKPSTRKPSTRKTSARIPNIYQSMVMKRKSSPTSPERFPLSAYDKPSTPPKLFQPQNAPNTTSTETYSIYPDVSPTNVYLGSPSGQNLKGFTPQLKITAPHKLSYTPKPVVGTKTTNQFNIPREYIYTKLYENHPHQNWSMITDNDIKEAIYKQAKKNPGRTPIEVALIDTIAKLKEELGTEHTWNNIVEYLDASPDASPDDLPFDVSYLDGQSLFNPARRPQRNIISRRNPVTKPKKSLRVLPFSRRTKN